MKIRTLKEVPLAQVQAAFSKALSDLAGREYSVVLHGLQFDQDSMRVLLGTEAISFSGRMESTASQFDDETLRTKTCSGDLLN